MSGNLPEDSEIDKMRAEPARLSKAGLDLSEERISLREGFQLANQQAAKLKVEGYKTEPRFISALRKFKLTRVYPIYGKTIREWIESPDPEMPIVGREELTSAKAVAELFRLRADQRRKLERVRKRATAKKLPKEIVRKRLRKVLGKKRNAKAKKRKVPAKKRKQPGK